LGREGKVREREDGLPLFRFFILNPLYIEVRGRRGEGV